MGVTLIFMLLATLTPFLFVQMKKQGFAIAHTVLLIGMWIYFFESVFHTAPALFSVTAIMFYLSLIAAEVGWVMFILRLVKPQGKYQKSYL
ncbi:hypothetical protein [Alteribacillus iranensis]|uniref:Uncharacterized protein n=1 Tax=Alteribacillus iranensis TaxID=930128 RepID=A0A1I2EC36_9BACI|nr:hypothetical protein [Alteribacillus iranensis]SFE90031.1 hypothetical protein SAMN05192532_105241 [Alteribacillus iranensis]